MAFIQRLIDVTFTLAQSNQGQGNSFVNPTGGPSGNTVKLSGLRVSCRIHKAGTASMATASIQIYGMPLVLMKQLSTLGMVFQLIPKNTITIDVGDAVNGMTTAFYGTIMQAWSDFQSAPDVPFHVEAQTLGAEAVIQVTPSSYNGSTDVAQVMGNLATQMNCTLEPNGVSVQLSNPYFYGSAKSQADACAAAANINWTVDGQTLAIWPKGKARSGQIPVISPSSGMIGYPTFANFMIVLKTVFNPGIKFGAQVQVESSLLTTATWAVMSLEHHLEAMFPHGKWESTIEAYNPAFPAPVLSQSS